MSSASTHIAAWQAAGLIDEETAERLRAADIDAPGADTIATDTSRVVADRPSKASAFFGPGV